MNTDSVVVPNNYCSNTVGKGCNELIPNIIKLEQTFIPRRNIQGLNKLQNIDDSVEKPSIDKSLPFDVDSLCSSLSAISSNSTCLREKKVHFATDNNGNVTRKMFVNQESRTQQETKASWYTAEEFMRFRRECRKEIFSMSKTNYDRLFGAVYEACSTGNFKAVTKERAYISAASCRGLEAVLYPTLQANRKDTVRSILKAQSALSKEMPAVKRQEILASTSRLLTKKARQLGRVLGSGDAAVVVANERIEASQQKALKDTRKEKKGVVPQIYMTRKLTPNSEAPARVHV